MNLKYVFLFFLFFYSTSHACQYIEDGSYLCTFTSGTERLIKFKHGYDDRGDFIQLGSGKYFLYLDGKATIKKINGNKVSLISYCQDYGQTLNVYMSTEGIRPRKSFLSFSVERSGAGSLIMEDDRNGERRAACSKQITPAKQL